MTTDDNDMTATQASERCECGFPLIDGDEECAVCGRPRPRPFVVELPFARITVRPGEPLLIGRDPRSPVAEHLDTVHVSREHAEIAVVGDGLVVRDLRSSNGTKVNGRALSPDTPHRLADADVVTFAEDLTCTVRIPQ
jgi:hypothetical protein